MTANHEHTPTTEEVKAAYRYDRTGKAIRLDDCSDPSIINVDHSFDHWLQRIVAAAEQRVAVKALRDAAEPPDLIGHMYREYVEHPLRSTLAPAAVRATATYLHDRANQIEGDDE